MTAKTRTSAAAPVALSQRPDLPAPRLIRSHEHDELAVASPRGASRSFDLIGALALALLFSPVIVVAAVAIAASGSPVLFRQARLGRGGRTFTVYKFCTMVPNAEEVLSELLSRSPCAREEWRRDFKLKRDPRVTRIGRFLRRTSLDELPQIWNILRGDMSLVGPRPVAPVEIEKYGRYARHYYAQRPGLTGLWQVSGRSNTSYEQRVILDAYYSRNRSLWMDIGIVLRTVRVVLRGSGAY